jgi:hypothetical protein
MLVSMGEAIDWVAGLDDLMARIAHRFGRVDPRLKKGVKSAGIPSGLRTTCCSNE